MAKEVQPGVIVVDHPLVQHKLTLMRDKSRSTKSFRQLMNEIGILLCYEVTRDLPLELTDIETPLQPMRAPVIAGKKLVFAPILRAGTAFLDGMMELVPSARVAHVGLYRDPKTLQAVEYYFKAPPDIADRLVIVLTRCSPPPTRPRPPSTGSRSAARMTCASSVSSPRRKESPSCAPNIRTYASTPPPSTATSTTTAT